MYVFLMHPPDFFDFKNDVKSYISKEMCVCERETTKVLLDDQATEE